MKVIVERCAGLDVHRDNVVSDRPRAERWSSPVGQQTQTFKATLAGLAELAE